MKLLLCKVTQNFAPYFPGGEGEKGFLKMGKYENEWATTYFFSFLLHKHHQFFGFARILHCNS